MLFNDVGRQMSTCLRGFNGPVTYVKKEISLTLWTLSYQNDFFVTFILRSRNLGEIVAFFPLRVH